ncbi:MAG: hypothetical protein ACOX3V_08235 [Bacillota bacterium]|jgi:hypothetical protein
MAEGSGRDAGNVGPRVKRPSYLGGPRPSGTEPHLPEKGENGVTTPEESPETPKEDVELYSWRIWLLPRRPLISVVVISVMVLCLVFAYWAFPHVVFVVAVTIILLNRLAAYLFPVTYTLTEETVGYRTILAKDVRDWGRFFTYHEFPDGVLLAHDVRSIRGRLREGLFLYYNQDGSNKDQVLKVVQAKLSPPAEARKRKDDEGSYKGGLRSALRRIRDFRKRT